MAQRPNKDGKFDGILSFRVNGMNEYPYCPVVISPNHVYVCEHCHSNFSYQKDLAEHSASDCAQIRSPDMLSN